MKQQTLIHTLKTASTKLAVATALLLTLNSTTASAQGCQTGSLTISTGIDPNTGSHVTGTDPKWTVSSLSSDVSSALGSPSVPYAAYTVTPLNISWTGNRGSSRWISVNTAGKYMTTSTGTFRQTFSRTFSMCSADQIRFAMDIAVDNWCSQMRVDGVPVFSQISGSYYTSFATISPFILSLGAGTHTIEVDVMNNSADANNPCGLQIDGTISSNTGGTPLVSETNNCATYVCCDANFTYRGSSVSPNYFDFNAIASIPGQYTWYVNGAPIGASPGFSYTFPGPGSWTVCLVYEEAEAGVRCEKCVTICVPEVVEGASAAPARKMMNTTSIKEEAINVNKIYPNPIDNQLNIELNNNTAGEATVNLYDATGRVVLEKKVSLNKGAQTFSLATNQLAPGVYVLSINNGTTVIKEKITKQ